MNKKFLFVSISIWIISQFVAYYLMPWIFLFLFYIGLIITIIILIVVQIINVIINRKNIKIIMVINLVVYLALLFFTFSFNRFIENIDWKIHYPFRVKAVEMAKENKLNLKEDWNVMYELPYKFPFVSYGGNNILVYRNNDSITVVFYVFYTMFNAPITYFVYTNNSMIKHEIEKFLISGNEYGNWKIQDNWYRLHGENIETYFH